MDVIVVGCGGVAFHAASWVRSMLETLEGGTVLAIDPDTVEKGNERRQWSEEGRYKTELFLEAVLPRSGKFQGLAVNDYVQSAKAANAMEAMMTEPNTPSEGWNGIMLLWPDNIDARRLAVSNLSAGTLDAEQVTCPIVTAGCDMHTAMAYGSICRGTAESSWPWRPPAAAESPVEPEEPSDEEVACGGQTVLANVMAASLSKMLLDYMVKEYVPTVEAGKPGGPCRLYWDGGRQKVWSVFG